MRIMTHRKRRSGTLVPFLVVLAVLTGCQAGPTEVQDAQNIEEQHRTPSKETPRLKPSRTTLQKNNSRLRLLPRPPNHRRRTLP